MPHRELIVIGASAGGIEALREVLAPVPADLAASVLVVMHVPATGGHALQRILQRATDLQVAVARDGEPLVHGKVYVAPGDSHLLVASGHLHVRMGPRENGQRPAVDPLFRSAAVHYGNRVIGVVLTGSLNDGTAGLLAISRAGGATVVQDPSDALYDSMPRSALEYVGAAHVAAAAEMGPLLVRLTGETVDGDPGPLDEDTRKEVDLMEHEGSVPDDDHPGLPSPWPCPDCNGVLWEIQDGPVLRFRCRVGHAWAADSLLEQQGESVESALWMGLRALEDRAALSRRLADQADRAGRRISASRYREDLGAMERSIVTLRRLLAGPAADPAPGGEAAPAQGGTGG